MLRRVSLPLDRALVPAGRRSTARRCRRCRRRVPYSSLRPAAHGPL